MSRLRALMLALAVSALPAIPARAQGFGYGVGYGYPGYGYGGGFGVGFPAFGYGGFGFPVYGAGFPPYDYTAPGLLTYGLPGVYPYGGLATSYGFGYANPAFGYGLSPLAVETAIGERVLMGVPSGYVAPGYVRGYSTVSPSGLPPIVIDPRMPPGTIISPAPNPDQAPARIEGERPEPAEGEPAKDPS